MHHALRAHAGTNSDDGLKDEVCDGHMTLVAWGDLHCFRKKGAPLEEQVSVLPDIEGVCLHPCLCPCGCVDLGLACVQGGGQG